MPTSDMTLKQQHKTAEMTTNDTKIGCNNVTTSEKSANTIYSKMAFSSIGETTGFENKKIRLRTYITSLRGP